MAVLAPLRRRLRVKVTALVVAVLGLGFGALLTLNLRHEQALLVAQHRATAELLATAIVSSIQNGMLQGRPDVIRRLVQQLRTEFRDVRRIDVYRRNGVEAFTDLETVETVNRLAGLDADVMAAIARMRREPGERLEHPLFRRAVETLAPQEVEERADGARVLTLFRPLANREPCQDCHGTDHRVRGVVRITLDLDPLEAALQAGRNRQVAVALGTILGVAAALAGALGGVVLRPLARVAAAAQRLGAGDLDARVPVTSADELGRLGQTINEMAGSLREARAALEARNAELAAALDDLRASMRKVELLEQIKGELARFVPEAVRELLERDPDARQLDKREADVSVLFLDVEGYTRLAEQLPPQRLNRLIQDYFSGFLEVLRRHHGDVNETAGDGLMVIFQSPGDPRAHARQAAAAAVELLGRVARLNQEFQGVYPPVAIRIGINSGPALVGATKIEAAGGARWTFTATGPTTNVAARIAALARGGEVTVGPETAARIQDRFVLEDTGEQALKNVSTPVRVYRLVLPGVYRQVAV